MSSALVHLELGLSERLGYVQCKFCTTILLVSVPCSNLLKMVAVQCGRCAGVLSVRVASPPAPVPPSVELPLQELGVDPPPRVWSDESTGDTGDDEGGDGEGEAVESNAAIVNASPVRKQRTPSDYNCFIKEEIKRIKGLEPNITHKEAFSTAAKNWAHLPRIQHRGN